MVDSLELKNVDFAYRDVPVLENVSHTFKDRCLTVICGPNGSGKSTLFQVASGMVEAQNGFAHLGGEKVSDIPAKERARRMAMLPQSPEAPPELLTRDLVALGRYAYRKPLAGLSGHDKDAIDNALASTDMAEFADRPLAKLSGGQRQRAWIAMVLAQAAPLVLLDEPTNHLDISHAFETMLLLRRLVQEQNKAVVVVLHDINLMTAFADEVILMQAGKIVASGSFEETVTETVLSDLYGRKCRFGVVEDRERPFVVVS